MCADLHQLQLRHAGCTHPQIMEFCREAQPVQIIGYLCTCGPHCIPLQSTRKVKDRSVVVQINEGDAGRFDPMEDGRVDWDATTVLVSAPALHIAVLCARRCTCLECAELRPPAARRSKSMDSQDPRCGSGCSRTIPQN